MKRLLQGISLAGLLGVSACASMEGVSLYLLRPEEVVKIGMSAEDVRRAIGPPFNIVQFRTESQPSWMYRGRRAIGTDTLVYIDFTPEGRVKSVYEQEIRSERPTP